MITRLVKMTFKPEKTEEFKALFDKYKQAIGSSPGCLQLELLNDVKNSHVFFTLSRWQSEEDLNNYRHSETFGMVWPRTKALFSSKPEAWSTYAEQVKI